MILERVEIVGFRGINRLSLMLEQNNVLIGENAWGKSSLLDALTLLLSPESDLYHFERDDSGSRREISTGENIICILF
ncbi:nucleoside triphosphate hydrolase domain [Escherichia coli]|uniref:Nucleoside triphosphate hydrolase domain n=1 Tax=Escherichia coli TaxID=562 RepID=A0A376UCW1_ECOLX|nr:nucleoside triphosphate hydrolase domain [Escherichia coli]